MVFRKGFTFSEIPFIWGLGWDLTVTFICTQVRHCSSVEKKKAQCLYSYVLLYCLLCEKTDASLTFIKDHCI